MAGQTQREAAGDSNLNQGRIGDANTVLDWAPDLAPNVVAGTLSGSVATLAYWALSRH